MTTISSENPHKSPTKSRLLSHIHLMINYIEMS